MESISITTINPNYWTLVLSTKEGTTTHIKMTVYFVYVEIIPSWSFSIKLIVREPSRTTICKINNDENLLDYI